MNKYGNHLWRHIHIHIHTLPSTHCCTTELNNISIFHDSTDCSFLSPPCLLQKPGMDVADGYVTFVRHSQDMLREKVNEEVYIERLFDVSELECPLVHRTMVG